MSEQSAKNRYLTLKERMDTYGRPVMLLDDKDWDAPITENPKVGKTEVWNLINLTSQPHPIHIHLIDFLVLDRRAFDVDKLKRKESSITLVRL
jgi:spore coat protein A, manganese oxidase